MINGMGKERNTNTILFAPPGENPDRHGIPHANRENEMRGSFSL